MLDNAEPVLEFNAEPSSKIDSFMAHAVSLANQLLEDRSVENLMQSIDNECSYFTGEMFLFCQTLLEPGTVSTVNDPYKNGLTSKSSSLNPKMCNSEKGKKSQLKVKMQAPLRKRTCLSHRNTPILRGWLLEHANNPFPTDNENDMLCLRTGLSLAKLNEWFVHS